MGHFYFLLVLGGLLLLAFALHLQRRFGRRARLPFVADQTLFTPPQWAFLAVLEPALGPEYRVYGRVRVAEVIGLRPRLDRAVRRRAWARLGDRQFDFLVCVAATGAIACAVNLAPRSRLGRPPPRDSLDRICAVAGLPLVRWREADDYPPGEVRQRLCEAIEARRAGPLPAPVPTAAPTTTPTLTPAPARSVAALPRRATTPSGVSAVLLEDAREPRLRPPPVRPRAAVTAATPAPPPAPAALAVVAAPAVPAESAALPASQAPRIEPTLAGHGDLDPGPEFHIDGALDEIDGALDEEDDRPFRAWRR